MEGIGGGFCPPARRAEGATRVGAAPRSSPLREVKQNIFQFLLEENGSRAKIEKREKCFTFCRRQAGGATGRVSQTCNFLNGALCLKMRELFLNETDASTRARRNPL